MHAPDLDLPRRERERLGRRMAMLAAAKSVFAERGFAGASLDEIAARAEFGKGTLYNYFPGGKEEILFAVFDELYDDLSGIVAEAFPEGEHIDWQTSARMRFRDLIVRFFEYFDARFDLFMILTREAYRMVFSDHDERVTYFLRQRERIAHRIAEPIRLAMEAGAIRSVNAEATAHLLFGNISGMQMHMAIDMASATGRCPRDRDAAPSTNGRWTPTQAADFLVTLLFEGLLIPETTATNHAPD